MLVLGFAATAPAESKVYLVLGHPIGTAFDPSRPLTPPPGTPNDGSYTHLRCPSMLDLTCRQHVMKRLQRMEEAQRKRQQRVKNKQVEEAEQTKRQQGTLQVETPSMG